MKLIYCEECRDLVLLVSYRPRWCRCEKYAGKYLDDYITAVVNEGTLVVGIDNRVDFFFCGWLPTKPGEVIFVPTFEEVFSYPTETNNKEIKSTNPVSESVSLL